MKSKNLEFSKASINTSWQTSCSVAACLTNHEISHFGKEYVLSAIRQRFWVINGRVSVKQIGRGYMVCKFMYVLFYTILFIFPFFCSVLLFYTETL